MAISTHLDLKNAVARYVRRSDLTADIPNFIGLAENRITNELDLPSYETELDVTISGREATLPADFLEQRRAYIDVADPVQRIEYRVPERFWDYDQGKAPDFPRIYTIEGNKLKFSPSASGSYDGKWLYLARAVRLVGDTDTNEILTNHTGLYLYGSLLEAVPFLKNDPRAITWATMYDHALKLAQELGARQRFPKGQKIMRSKVPIQSGLRTKM